MIESDFAPYGFEVIVEILSEIMGYDFKCYCVDIISSRFSRRNLVLTEIKADVGLDSPFN